jgi:hypothetical protein
MAKTIYYLPGHGGLLSTGLGDALLKRGFDVVGRETVGDFRALPFSEQISVVADDIKSNFWSVDARVVANSFGAYLFLNAQKLFSPFIGRVLLLSPIVGEFSNEEISMGFIPPQSGKLMSLVQSGLYPAPLNCEIHVGEQDWQSNPANVAAFAGRLDIPVSVVPNSGHLLDKAYVSSILDRWLPVQ